MKKILFIFIVVFAALCVSNANAASYSFVWAEKKPAFIDNSPADHTYTAISRAYTNKVYRYSYHGVNYGGSYLSGTFGITDNTGDTRIRCIACYNPYWCKVKYLKEGVCHQDTNRALYPVGLGRLTVDNARGYSWSKRKYDTYGLNAYKWYKCRQNCWFGESGW